MSKKQKGFSLIELLIVVAIILIIAAIAIPNLLRSRMAANEASAVGSIRTMNTAAISYNSTYGNGFPSAITQIGTTGTAAVSCDNAELIDSVLTSGTKSGYTFKETPFAVNGINTSYVVGASALTFNQSGVRDFCSVDDFVIRSQTPTAQSTPVAVYATCQGWTALQ